MPFGIMLRILLNININMHVMHLCTSFSNQDSPNFHFHATLLYNIMKDPDG